MVRKILLALSLTGSLLGSAAVAQSIAGPYLAGRQAAVNSDFAEAANYYAEALTRDPDNSELLESTVLSYLSLGDVDRALPLARRLDEQSQNSQIARMVMTAGLVASDDYAALLDRDPETEGIGPWVDGLVRAWAHVGAGNMEAALAAFDALSTEAGMQSFVIYHKALALASVGDFAGAEAIFGAPGGAGAAAQTRRGVLAHVQVLSELDRPQEALTVLRTSFGEATDPELDAVIAQLEAGDKVPFSLVENAREGIAEVYFTFSAVLRNEDAGDYYVLLYARVARYLDPDHIDAILLTADLLESLDQQALAIEVYRAVPPDDPAFHVAELGRAEALRRADKRDQAIEVLQQLTRSHGEVAAVHSALGDTLRGAEDYAAAIEAYNSALELAPETAPVRWVLYYSRGIAHERLGNDVAMEEDFRAALALNSEQPQVLNYLGYSLVEQDRNLDEALDMIERAVAASPNSGYIVDSLGWVLYRLGRYEEAVVQMERAVELMPVDPVVNDHLGDVYWAVDRRREAEFQWRRALSFIDPEDDNSDADPARMRRKLEVGLDAVLEEEGEPPLTAGNDI
ncbi:MAG: tetratricopeptide repeat protein [Sulfitobacter sp.]|nr:tetratricopeptide repeat protein [Sulfitobacter sp.]